MKNSGRQGYENILAETHEADQDMVSMTDEMWLAIVNSDSSFDGKFYYGVQTTGIFCRPSCRSRMPNKENVRIFHDVQQAQSENFRPCKRCKPNGKRLPDEEWVAQIVQFIETNYFQTLTLGLIAEMCHGSPFHLQRVFKRIKGITPAQYIHQLRISKAMQYLSASNKTITDIALAVGVPNTAYFVTLFKKKTGLTPTDYRQFNNTGNSHGGVKSGTGK